MIIVRAPLRIPLGGGGTDLPSYYEKRGGALISAGINKYVYVSVNKRFEQSIRVSYSKTEIVDKLDEIEHPIVREALRLLGLDRQIEITTVADIPGNSGMGSSSTFAVALLLALHTYKREHVDPRRLAEEAYHIEREILHEPVGKQDQYLAAYGGITTMDIGRDGEVEVGNVVMSEQTHDDFESNLLLFYTGIHRKASEVLAAQDKGAKESDEAMLQRLDTIKDIGMKIRSCVTQGDIRGFGALMHTHWEMKRKLSSKVSNAEIDEWYELARRNGALGGKLMGAGGGGFLLIYCDSEKARLRSAFAAAGLREVRFHVDWEGAKVLANVI